MKWLSVVIVLITTIIVPLVLFEDESNTLMNTMIRWAQDEPLPTALVVILALSSDVLFPVPNGVVNTVAGSLFGWVMGALVIWLGLTLGCLIGYGVGSVAGRPLTRRFVGADDLRAAHDFAARLGAVTLVVTRTVPMVGDIATIAAGITSYPFGKYILITSLANAGVAIVFAGIGSQAEETGSVMLAFVGAIALPLAAWLLFKLSQLRSTR